MPYNETWKDRGFVIGPTYPYSLFDTYEIEMIKRRFPDFCKADSISFVETL